MYLNKISEEIFVNVSLVKDSENNVFSNCFIFDVLNKISIKIISFHLCADVLIIDLLQYFVFVSFPAIST